MEYNRSVEIHQSSEDVKRSMSPRSSPEEFDRKPGVPETMVHGVRAETVSTANTAQSVHGGMGNTYNNYYYLLGRREEAITEMINQLAIGTQIDNNVLEATQGTPMGERKSRVRPDSESGKQVMVEDHSPQHRQAVTDVAKDAAAEDALEEDASTEDVIETATDATTEVAAEAVTDATTEVVAEATSDATAGAGSLGMVGEPPKKIKPSLVSALYHSMGILFRGRNASQLKDCLPGLEIRQSDINLQSKGLLSGRCNEEAEYENTEERIEDNWVMVSEEDACSTSIVRNEAISRASSDRDDSLPQKVRVSQPTTTRQSQGLDIDNKENIEMPFDTGGRYKNSGTGSSTSERCIQPENQEIRLGNQVKECTTPRGDNNTTMDVPNEGWTLPKQGGEILEAQYKHLLEQWKQIDQRHQAVVMELLNNVIYHARNQSEKLRTLLPMLREMSCDIAPGVPFQHNRVDDSYVGLFTLKLTDIGCDLSRKTATNVVNYILTIGRNNPKLLVEIAKKMDHLDNISYQ